MSSKLPSFTAFFTFFPMLDMLFSRPSEKMEGAD
jgi:hypothetical protein